MRSAATAPHDRGAPSGPIAWLSFIGGIGAANALADLPYPRPKQTRPRSGVWQQQPCC
jgi:hypothetical protein